MEKELKCLSAEEFDEILKEMENDLRLYPIEEGLEDDIIDYINGKELNDNEKRAEEIPFLGNYLPLYGYDFHRL